MCSAAYAMAGGHAAHRGSLQRIIAALQHLDNCITQRACVVATVHGAALHAAYLGMYRYLVQRREVPQRCTMVASG